MKHFVALFFIGAVFFISDPAFAEKSLNLRLADGSVRSLNLATLTKLSFAGETMLVSTGDLPGDIFDLSQIHQFSFSLLSSGVQTFQSGTFSVYPSPARDKITLENIPEGAVNAVFYSMDGRMVRSVSIKNRVSEVNISSFQKGLYLVKAGNKTLKFCKL